MGGFVSPSAYLEYKCQNCEGLQLDIRIWSCWPICPLFWTINKPLLHQKCSLCQMRGVVHWPRRWVGWVRQSGYLISNWLTWAEIKSRLALRVGRVALLQKMLSLWSSSLEFFLTGNCELTLRNDLTEQQGQLQCFTAAVSYKTGWPGSVCWSVSRRLRSDSCSAGVLWWLIPILKCGF